MIISLNRNENELIVALEGRLDTLTSPDLEEKLESAIEDVTRLVFDFEKLEYISSAGLRVLLTATKIMDDQGEMIITNVCPAVMEIFEVTGFTDILTIE